MPGTTEAGELRNVYQRKLAVMEKCGSIVPDKRHPAHDFMYVSVQTVSNHLRKFAAEEGLDILVAPNEAGDRIVVELTNADDPTQQIIRSWPMVNGDKAWSYTSKYALIRMFLIGDGEEADEADMADASAAQNRQAQTARPAAASRPAAQEPDAAPPPVPTGEEVAELIRLASSLPRPIDVNWVDEQLTRYPAAGVRKALLNAHEKQCGSASCAHVVPLPAGAAS